MPLFCLAVEWGRAAYTSCNSCLLHVWCQSSEEYCYLATQRSTCNASYEVFPWNKLARREITSIQCCSRWNFVRLWLAIHINPRFQGFDGQASKSAFWCYEYHNIFGELFCHTNSRRRLYVTWQDTTSKSIYYQQQLIHYSWTLLVIISRVGKL